MRYEISPDRKTLTITADEEDRERIVLVIQTGENEQGVTTDMHDLFEPLTCNSELEWINPEDTGDLTNAPMLGIRETEFNNAENCLDYPVKERWAFMDYQVRSVLEDLRDTGKCVFTS